MTREEYEKIIDKKLKAVKEELMAEYKEEEPSIDGWKVGDKYYVRANDRDICAETIDCDMDGKIDDYDIFNITHGYAKRTAREVQFQIERDAVLYELSKYAEPKDRKWDGKTNHFYISCNMSTNRVIVGYICTIKSNDIYFATAEDAEKAIEEVGKHRIAKFYLGVDLNE